MNKAAFFDIDGTLWDEKNFIPDSTRRAIKELRENGVLTFLNSGRCRAFINNKDLLSLGFDGIVSGCGTMIELHDDVIYKKILPEETTALTVETCEKYGFRAILEGPDNLYMNYDEFAENVFGQKVIAETNGKTLATHEHEMDWKISKLSCDLTYCKDEDIAACYEELSSIYYYIKHNTEIVEMVPHGFSKGTGIEKVCELLDVPIQNTYAFGDSPNDMEMLKVAGNAVVMGNGFDEVKAIGDYVTDDLYHDGIYNACKYYNLI